MTYNWRAIDLYLLTGGHGWNVRCSEYQVVQELANKLPSAVNAPVECSKK